MRVEIKKGAPSLRNFLNRGGLVKDWVHRHTNYDAVCRSARRAEGFNSPAYFEAVREIASLGGEGLKANAHIQALAAWEADRLARAD